MPEATPAGTVAEKAASKKRVYRSYPIDIGSSKTDIVLVREDVATYFNFPEVAATDATMKLIKKEIKTGKSLYVDLLDESVTNSANGLGTQRFLLPPAIVNSGGQAIIVPTEMKTGKGNTRLAIVNFPNSAILAAISNFLALNCKSKKPAWFKRPGGKRRAVVLAPTNADINPGIEKPAEPAGGES